MKYNQQNILVWINLAYLEYKLGNVESCNMICEKVISIDPNNEKVFELRGDLCKR